MDAAAPVRRFSRLDAVLWSSCAALLTAGLWMTFSVPATNAHVQVKPQIGSVAAITGTVQQSRVGGNTALYPTNNGPALGHKRDTAVQAGGAEGGSDLLALSAVLISLWAATITLLRGKSAEAPAPVSYGSAQPVVAAPVEKPVQMDEVAIAVKADQESRKFLTPKQAILELQAGNARFWSGTPLRPELNAIERRALIIAQAPTVCIISCADSRVPVELVFDQGLGSIFVVRVAGNILDATAMGSVEFAVKYLGVKAVLVMGHEGCGAVKGAMSMSPSDLQEQPIFLKQVLLSIKENLNVNQLNRIQDSRAQDREAVVTNASSQVKKLQQNELIAERVANGSLLVAGAFYEITSGIVDFFTLDKNGLVTDI